MGRAAKGSGEHGAGGAADCVRECGESAAGEGGAKACGTRGWGALGARRWRIFQQVIAEGLLLGLIGAMAGLTLGWTQFQAC